MTSSLRHNSRRGFTLIEVLVVMGIILMLISILLPAVIRANRDATRAKMLSDLMEISQGLEAYKQQFGDYPHAGSGSGINGSTILCWALLAPGPATGTGSDGADGLGFRIRTASQGEVYGPYLRADRFRIGTLTPGNTNAVSVINPPTVYDDTQDVIGDMYGNVILYYPANLGITQSAKPYVGAYVLNSAPPQPIPTFNYDDNANVTTPGSNNSNTLTQHMLEYRLGNHSMSGTIVTGSEIPVVTGPYILWCAGPDGLFGPQVSNSTGTNYTTGSDDDVTYPDNLDMVPAGKTP